MEYVWMWCVVAAGLAVVSVVLLSGPAQTSSPATARLLRRSAPTLTLLQCLDGGSADNDPGYNPFITRSRDEEARGYG